LFKIIFLSSQSHYSILINKHFHGRNYLRNKNVNPKIIFVAHMQSRPFYIFLYDIQVLWPFHLLMLDFLFLLLTETSLLVFQYVNFLVHLNIFIHFYFLFVVNFVQILFDLFNILRNKNSSALRAWFWFAYKQ
jgi:hypothetical protein